MSKILAVLVALSVAYAVQGCKMDSCSGRPNGPICYQSNCGPCNYYYRCNGGGIVYNFCNMANYCIIGGRCRRCGDSCEGRRDGRYQSVNRARPYFYTCEAGQLFYQECQPTQVFNPWTKRCECFEGVCLHGDGWRISFCRGNGWRVKCLGGFPVKYRQCPRPRPYVCCRTNQCVPRCGRYISGGRCCRN
ncbi:hypothetical protein LSAT2_002524 [Lamellibrachia satsuma]|nr:hypothetical protein LSAT2_002524 [Lamellibrachia satsuma]